MAATPTNVLLQQANGNVLVSWNYLAGAVSYNVQRDVSPSMSTIALSTFNTTALSYLDTSAIVDTQYYYSVASVDASANVSVYSTPQTAIPTGTGKMSLLQLRTASQQRADLVNSNFITTPEWNSYINQSCHELYDLLITCYEDYFMAPPWIFLTNGSKDYYRLPDGTSAFLDLDGNPLPAFQKLLGVDCGLSAQSTGPGQAYVTIKKFDFIARNRYVYPNITSTFLGVYNMQYRLMGNNLRFIPVPAANQHIRVWYIPRLVEMLADTDTQDFFCGWSEYVIVDAAIKAMQKEECDCSLLMQQKAALLVRIEDSAMNRDASQPDTISDVRSQSEKFGAYGAGGQGDGPNAGY
jgi:hypothetical protein